MTFHVIISKIVKDTPSEKLKAFHKVIKLADADWPYVGSIKVERDPAGSVVREIEDDYRVCKKCGGRIWANPRFSPGDLKVLAKQLGLKIKIKRFTPETTCAEWHAGRNVVLWERKHCATPVEI